MKPTLFIVCGQIGVGKTTTAKHLGKMLNCPVASVDTTINRIFEEPSNAGKDVPFNDYELKICYNVFALLTEHLLKTGNSVIIDGAFAKKSQRQLLISAAEKLGCSYKVLYITCTDDLIKERASKRFKTGKGVGWEAHLKLKKVYEPLDINHEVINTSRDVKSQLKMILKQ